MTQRGMVYKTEGDSCRIVVFRQSSCGENCQSCGLCAKNRVEITAKNTCGAREGDIVRIESSSKSVLFVVFIVYLLPIIFFAAGLALLYSATKLMSWGIAGGVCGFILAFLIAKRYNRRIKEKGGLSFEIFVDNTQK